MSNDNELEPLADDLAELDLPEIEEEAVEPVEEQPEEDDGKKKKKKKKEKKPKKTRAKKTKTKKTREPREARADRPKPAFNVYTVMLAVALAAISVACLLLYLELTTYGDFPWYRAG